MSKKMLPIYVIETLKRYSDKDHQLLQKDIIQYIQNNYNETFERKAIGRCIHELVQLNYDIIKEYGFYLDERTFNKNEIQFLIDNLLSYQSLTQKQLEDIINKIVIDESNYTKRALRKIPNISKNPSNMNQQILLNIEMIEEAIQSNKKISFHYLSYGLDKQLHKRREEKYIVNPYELIMSMDRYYLIGNYDKYDNIANFRIDKICNVEILDENIKYIDNNFNLPQYRLEHIYMFSGPIVDAKIKFENSIIDQIIDWFSIECHIYPCDQNHSFLCVKVNKNALYYWLKQYDDHVELISTNEE